MADCREIPLSQGEVAIVDEEDYDHLSQWQWFCHSSRGGHKYAARNQEDQGGMVLMHRVIVAPPEDKVVDHINGDGLDNRKKNLRVCRHKDNIRAQKPQEGCTSEFRGVNWKKDQGKWRAGIRVDGEKIHLGYFDDERKAARAYNEAAKKHFGEYAYENEIL